MARALETYKRKRDFGVTPEPPPKKKASKGGNSYVIQKHAARRLHYDFRLELDGVLLSWAVTKGPSLVPGEKRLAVHTEDHPLDYGGFEGTIPEGQYGAGSVMVWDRGTWEAEGDPRKGMEKGHLDFTLHGEKLTGRWHLVRMRQRQGEKAENWLLIKSEDDAARTEADPDILEEQDRSVLTGRSIEEIGSDRKSREWQSNREAATPAPSKARSPRKKLLEAIRGETRATAAAPAKAAKKPASRKAARGSAKQAAPDPKIAAPRRARALKSLAFIEPQLATLAEKPPSGAAYIHEIKFDGYRMQATLENGQARLWTRKGLDWTAKFQTIADAVEELGLDGLHLDGEIVVEDQNGIADFAGLQSALKEGHSDRLVYYVFDLLALDGRDLTPEPLIERKRLLQEVLARTPANGMLRYSAHFEENGATMLQHVCRLGAEGIVSKKRDCPYRSGRSLDWLKSKCANRQEFVVIGYVPSTTSRKAVGSLVLGFYDKGRLTYAGRVGTGFSSKLAIELQGELVRDKLEKPPLEGPLPADVRRGVVWVAPKRVAEVEFRGWTGSGILRQASFKGMREDKDPKEIVREAALATPAGAKGGDPAPSIALTHPDRLLWPEAGITKQGLADYYAGIWSWIAPHVTGRPLALVRCPMGIAQQCFFQKHEWKGMDSHVVRVRDPQDPEPILSIQDLDGLIALVQASVLEIHPWGARNDDLDHPDRLTFDLDPGDAVNWPDLVAAAREVRARLKDDYKLESFVKTSGGKGLHVVVPLTPRADWDEAKDFCRKLAEAMAKDTPALYTANMAKRERDGRIYVDYLRNGRGATAVAAYSPRARSEAGVSTPLTWAELDASVGGAHFTLLNLPKRLDHLSRDPWQGFEKVEQVLPNPVKAKAARRR